MEVGILRDLAGKSALVMAGGSGIGRATSLLMAERGASVVVTDINQNSAADVAEEIKCAGGRADAFVCDVGSEAQIGASVDHVLQQFGRLDILFNNAALMSAEAVEQDVDILTISTAMWDRVMQVTLRGTMLGCRYGVAAMLRTGGGAIVNTSSVFGLAAHNVMSAYGVAKSGVAMLTSYVATSFGRQGIRCNAVAPGLILTPTTRRHATKEFCEMQEASTLIGRVGDPGDVAEVVAFLASDRARHLTGQVIPVDGGSLFHQPTYADYRRLIKLPEMAVTFQL